MIQIDMENGWVSETTAAGEQRYSIGTAEAFSVISKAWLRSGWDNKYVYSFAWMGRPVIQLPEDMLRIQEVIYQVKPDVLIETGIAHGGSLIFYASLFKAMGKGRVVGVDIEIRPHNRAAIEAHELYEYLTLIEGSSTAPEIVEQVKQQIKPGDTVMVVLDSCHSKEHVLGELEAYAPLVTQGSTLWQPMVSCTGWVMLLVLKPTGAGITQKTQQMSLLPSTPNLIIRSRAFRLTKVILPRWSLTGRALG